MDETLDVNEVQKLIPHRYPFLFVDKITELEPGHRAVGIKNVSANEWFFEGHFPGYPLMPGVLVIEALAQVGVAVMMSLAENRDKLVLFAGIDKVRFKKEVKPGDQLTLTMNIDKSRGRFGKGAAEASVDGRPVATAELLFMLADKPAGG